MIVCEYTQTILGYVRLQLSVVFQGGIQRSRVLRKIPHTLIFLLLGYVSSSREPGAALSRDRQTDRQVNSSTRT